MISHCNPQTFRDAMARLGAAVNLVTTDGPAGRFGLTATAVCSVTDDPPTVLVCVNRQSHSLGAMLTNNVLAVNVLRECHVDMATQFSTRALTPDQKFATGQWRPGPSGAPVLVDAIASFDCAIVDRTEVGSHCVLYCIVRSAEVQDTQDGLIYFGRSYRSLTTVGHAGAIASVGAERRSQHGRSSRLVRSGS